MRAPARHAAQQAAQRPLGLTILSVAGVLFGLALAFAALGYAGMQALVGSPPALSTIGALSGFLLALVIVWFYWGLWEMLSSAWWAHMILGPVAVVALVLLIPMLPTAFPLLAGPLPQETREIAERAANIALFGLVGLECATVGYLPTIRQQFGIGRRKQAWER